MQEENFIDGFDIGILKRAFSDNWNAKQWLRQDRDNDDHLQKVMMDAPEK